MLVGIAGRFTHSLLGGLIQRSHIALRMRSQGLDQIPKGGQAIDRNSWGTECKVDAFRTEHPGRKRADCAVWQLAKDVFTVTVLHALLNTQCPSEQRVPAVVDRYGFKSMCIM
jgi:hypothetical protein